MNYSIKTFGILLLIVSGPRAFALSSHLAAGFQCGPETQTTTAIEIKKILEKTASKPGFETANGLQETVNKTKDETNTDRLLSLYLSKLGVDSRNIDQTMEFIGARDFAPYIASAQKNLGLSEAQAETLVSEMSAAALKIIEAAK